MSEEDEISNEDEGSRRRVRLGRLKRKNGLTDTEDEVGEPKRRRGKRSKRGRKRPAEGDLDEEEREISQGRLWLSQNWKTMLALFLIFIFGLFLRSYFYYGPATEGGFILSGNDPYYHKRVVDYVQETHHHLIFDPLLSYPDGALNPRPPMFDWSIAILGLILSPLFGGDVTTSTWQVMEFSPAFWGALTAIPVYLIGKEMFNRKVGLISALLISTMPSHVERSPLGFSDHDAIALFFVVLSFFFFIKALNHLKVRDKWVNNWFNPKEIPSGIKEWFKYNQVPVAFSMLAGISLASIALIWKGFLYPVVIIIVYFFIQMILNKLRNKDSLGVAMCTIITLVIVAVLPIPYYYGNHMHYIIEPAAEILLAVIIVSAVLVPTRDSPWLLVFSALAILIISGLILLIYVFPEIGTTYFSGQGYFSENKVFSTIAEAQAPDYSRAMFSYGIVTTFLALYAILLSIIRVAKDIKAHYLFMTIWGITAVYMAVSATRFIFNAGPIFAILSGWIVYEIIVRLDFRKMMKHYRSLKGGGRFYALKKSVKVSHIVGVLFLVFMIFLPNLWLGWDAGVPFGEKKDVDVAVYDALPWFMRPEEYKYDERGNTSLYPDGVGIMYNRTNQNELKYFGAFGHGFPSDYWLDGMRWLSEQDTELPIEERPGFISWWDYGFWAIYLGQHPTAADNFQGRVQYAGSMISAYNESQGVSLLIVRIIEGDMAEYYREHKTYGIHDDVKAIMVKYFGEEHASNVTDVLINPTKYKDEVLDNPDRYGYYSSDLVPNVTPIYAVLQTWIPELLADDEMTWLLHDLQEQTGYSLRYFAIDSRLFPYGAGNTGIYYAPLKLSDHRISDSNEPYDYLETYIVASDAREYTGPDFSKAVEANPNLEFQSYKLKYYEPFLESMLYKCYVGYTLDDIGASESADSSVVPNLPGIHVSQYPPLPAWMMKHFQLVYRTAYWNPYNQSEYQLHPDAWVAMSEMEANDLVTELENDGLDNDGNGEIDDSGEGGVVTSGLRSGVVYIKYYEGAYLNGNVTTSKGSPIPNIRVTVQDEYGIPHDSVFTDENGSYQLILPEGNVSIHVSTGGFGEGEYVPYGILSQVEQGVIEKTNITVTDDMAMRREMDLDADGIWDYNIVKDFEVDAGLFEGRLFWDNNYNDIFEADSDFNISDAKVTMHNTILDKDYFVDSAQNGTFTFDDLTPGDYEVTFEIKGHNITLGETMSYTEGMMDSRDRPVKPASVFGNITSFSGDVFANEDIEVVDMTNHTTIMAQTDSEGNYNLSWLLPGNYTINIDIDGFESQSDYVNLTEGNITEKNIVLQPSTDVEGTVTRFVDSSPIANATVRFTGTLEAEDLIKFATADENGIYSVDLRNGPYNIYVKHDSGDETPYVYFGKVDADGGIITHDISLAKTTEVFGVVYTDFDENGTVDPFEARPYMEISFKNSLGERRVTTNLSGYYRVFLPQGDYTVYSTFNSNKNTGLELFSVSQTGRIQYNFTLLPGKKLDGHVYYDINKNDEVDDEEGLPYGAITFTDESGIDVNVFTDSEGAYSVNLPSAWNYTAYTVYPGFAPFNLPFSNITELEQASEFSLTPINITITGYTQYEGTMVGDINITFTAVEDTGAENRSLASNSSGYYSVELAPGEYNVIVDHNTTEMGKPVWYTHEGMLSIEVGEGSRIMNLNLTKKIKINGTIFGTSENVTVNFERHRVDTTLIVTVNGSFEVYLEPDDYNVSVDYPVNSTTHYVYLSPHSLMESETLMLNLTLGIRINGTVFYDSVPEVEIFIWITGNGTLGITSEDPSGNYERFLPPNRTYDVIVNVTKEDAKYLFTYFGSIDVNTTDITGFDLDLTKFVKVKGTTYIDWDNDTAVDTGEPMDNITIHFESDSGIISTMTNETGAYELYLLNDEFYNITLTSDFSIVDEKLNITPSATNDSMNLPITLMNLTVSGRTLRGAPENFSIIWFIKENPTAQNATTTSDENGNYSVELHFGDYTVYARKISGPDVFVYLDKISVRPRENISLDLDLVQGNRVFGGAYYFNSTYQNLSAKVRLDFLGNGTISTFSDLNGLYEIWLPKGPYEVFANLATFEFNMSMNYTFKGRSKVSDDTALSLNLSKVKVYRVGLEWIEGVAVTIDQNESVTYNISIVNTGNIEETFDLAMSGVSEFNLTFPTNITLGIGESDIFEIVIGASPNAIVEHVDIKIDAYSRTDSGKLNGTEILVNITQHFKPVNLSFADAPIIAKNNTLNYTIDYTNEGNGQDEFNFTLSGIPEYWEFTLSEETMSMLAGETRSLTLIFTIPYNASELNTTVILTAVSTKSNETSSLEIQISPANLRIDKDDLSVSGDQVSEGELNTEPIPGFESLVLVLVLIGVAFVYRRRRDKQ